MYSQSLVSQCDKFMYVDSGAPDNDILRCRDATKYTLHTTLGHIKNVTYIYIYIYEA